MIKRLSSVDKYEVTSDSYDQLYRGEQYSKFRYIFFEKKLPIKNVILDIGCGTGLLIEFMKKHGIDFFKIYFCLEPSMNMLMKVIEKGLCDERIVLLNGYGENLPIRDRVVDAIYLFTVWDNVEDRESLIKEVLRVLAPKGYVLISTLGKVHGPKPSDYFNGFKLIGCKIDCFYLYQA